MLAFLTIGMVLALGPIPGTVSGGAHGDSSRAPCVAASLTIQGIGLRSSLADVTRALGPAPKLIRAHGPDSNRMEEVTVLLYPGLDIKLSQPKGASNFHVMMIRLQSTDFAFINGLAVGNSRQQLDTMLGRPQSIDVEGASGHDRLHYTICAPADTLRVELANDRTIEIELREEM